MKLILLILGIWFFGTIAAFGLMVTWIELARSHRRYRQARRDHPAGKSREMREWPRG